MSSGIDGIMGDNDRREDMMISILAFLNVPNTWCKVFVACEAWRAEQLRTSCPTGFADWYYPFNGNVDLFQFELWNWGGRKDRY